MNIILRDAVIKALDARGEKRLHTGKFIKYTRTYWAARDTEGRLLPIPFDVNKFYFIGRMGAVRIGRTIATSRPLTDDAKATLVAEGRGIV